MHPPNVAWLIIVVTDRKARARRRVELAWFKALSDHCALIFIIVGTTGVESGGVLVARGNKLTYNALSRPYSKQNHLLS